MNSNKKDISKWVNLLKGNIVYAILYPLLLLFLPIYSIFWCSKIIVSISTAYQVAGIFLLYFEEKYKMEHTSFKFGKLNSRLLYILRSWKMCKFALREIYRNFTNYYKDDCDIKVNVSLTKINHSYKEIEDPAERLEQQLISIESDLVSIRYFSEVRKTGYILIAIGYILQFLISFCSMFSFCFCTSQ
jgi:hypothetical protein